MRPTTAVINLTHLKNNYLNLKEKAGNRPVIAVVKADAYGHGMIKCAEALEKLASLAPAYYGVALAEEGIALREKSFITKPVLSFAPFDKTIIDTYLDYNIIPTVVSSRNIDELAAYTGERLKAHVNVDTGMSRLGIPFEIAAGEIERLAAINNVIVDGVYTHFATSDERDKSYANLQLNRFKNVISSLKEKGVNYGKAHAANSGAVVDMPESYFDMIRPGMSLYGYFPSQETTESVELEPVMSIVSKISDVREVKKGDSVSYGRRFYAGTDIYTATVPVGYADGVLRNMSNKLEVIINGKKYRQIGRVTMDRIVIDTGEDKLIPGENVILLGRDKDTEITGWDWALIQDTIPYEVTCNISRRVPREYTD